jgi:hypothetical protein
MWREFLAWRMTKPVLTLLALLVQKCKYCEFLRVSRVANDEAGTHFTRFTGTKVQILTQKALFFLLLLAGRQAV